MTHSLTVESRGGPVNYSIETSGAVSKSSGEGRFSGNKFYGVFNPMNHIFMV